MRQDPSRLAELRRRLILDSSRERAYDDLARLLASSLEVPIAMVNLLDSERDWFKSFVGLPLTESPAQQVILRSHLQHIAGRDCGGRHAARPALRHHPLVVNAPFVRFYTSARLTADGHTLGTLCAYDLRPRKISTAQIAQMRTLATAAMVLISARPNPSGR